jgi:eukaryotic-like serine/threonine-protein kinase
MSRVDGPMFGRYVVSERVGEGSLGVVYRARHAELGRNAAVKVLRSEVRSNPAAVAGMVSEAATLARLDHPNIVALYDFVQEPERTWLAEQWVDGAPLDAILEKHGRLTPEQALGVVAGALTGLAHAHDSGVVHRDVAASNVLADMAGTSMLVDFGLASPVEGESGSGSAGVVGTPAYLSPEAARGGRVGKPGDVYSAAALTFHLLSGGPVFSGSAWEMVTAHRDRPAPALADHGPRLAGLMERSLDKDPGLRPPDAGAFLAELEEAAEERYGVGWWERASISGLVASTMGLGIGTVAGSAGGVAQTGVAEGVPPGATRSTRAVVDTGRRVRLKTIAAAGAIAAVVVTGLVMGVTLAANDDSDAPSSAQNGNAAEPNTNTTTAAAPTQPALEPLQGQRRLSGRWNAENELGQTFGGSAKLSVDCAATCRVRLARAEGSGVERLEIIEGTYQPVGDNEWVAVIDEPLRETLPGCEALRAEGSSTLTWDGTRASIEASIEHAVLPENTKCVLIASTVTHAGTPAG